MTAASLPVWRSLLFVPVTAKRFVDGAARRGADAIILDLEDSIAASEKERARTLVPEAAEIVSRGGADVVVRLNRPLRMTVRDLEAVIGPGVQAVALPKAESADHVRLVAEIIDEVEAERGMPIEQIQKFLGHAKLETTQVYAESTAAMIKASYQQALSG